MNGEDRSRDHADGAQRSVPVAWAALEDAFENNAPEVHSYLHLVTGDVIRVVDGVADPVTHSRIVSDGGYRRVDPVSSREQYRWMERFIATVEDPTVRQRLLQSIDGKGAFRRFKDALMVFPTERERWFAFRSERLKMCMEAWLESQQLSVVPRPEWPVPPASERPADGTPSEITPSIAPSSVSLPPAVPSPAAPSIIPVRRPSVTHAPVRLDGARARLVGLASNLPTSEIESAIAYLEFLHERGVIKSASPVTVPPPGSAVLQSPPVPSDRLERSELHTDLPPPRRVVGARDHEPRRPSEAEASRSAVMPVVDADGVRKSTPESAEADPARPDPTRRSSGRG